MRRIHDIARHLAEVYQVSRWHQGSVSDWTRGPIQNEAVALIRADQCRVGVVFWVLPFIQGDRHSVDIHARFNDRVIRKVGQPVAVRPAVAELTQDDSDIDVTVRPGLPRARLPNSTSYTRAAPQASRAERRNSSNPRRAVVVRTSCGSID